MNAESHPIRQMPNWIYVGLAMGLAVASLAGCQLMAVSSLPAPVTLAPRRAILNADTVNIVGFNAGGGDGKYTWSLSNASLGIVFTTSQAVAFYKSVTNIVGTNVVTVTDVGGRCASATITQNWPLP